MDIEQSQSSVPAFRALTEEEVSSLSGAGGPSATISTPIGPVQISVSPSLSGITPNGGTITLSSPNSSTTIQSNTPNYNQAAADLNRLNNAEQGIHTPTTEQEIQQAIDNIMKDLTPEAKDAAQQDFDMSSFTSSTSSSSSSSGGGRSQY